MLMKKLFHFFPLVFNRISIKNSSGFSWISKRKILMAQYFKNSIKHYIYVISSYLLKIYMYIYLYLFILPSLKSCFFLAECDKQDEVDKCWLYFFISSNLSLFFLSIPYDCMFTEGKQGNTYRKGICQATHVFKVRLYQIALWHYRHSIFVFFFKFLSSLLIFFLAGDSV